MPDSLTPTSTEAWRQYTILIVDDEPGVIADLKALLRLEGYTAVTALSGEEGLERLREVPARLVISDQKMAGGMSGTEFLTRVREEYPEAVTMILSAFSEPQYLMEAVNQANVFQYILKPWHQDDLLHKIAQALQFYHARAEQQRLARANERLLRKMTLLEGFSLIGEFSTALYDRFFPLLHGSLLADRERLGAAAGASPDRSEWGHLGTVVSRLGQVGMHYHLPAAFRERPLPPLVRRCMAEARRAAEGLAIDWREEIADGLPPLLIQEETLAIALKALIENAVLFGRRPAGRQRVAIRVYAVERPEPAVRIEVSDDGPGVANPGKIFGPLYSECLQRSAPWIHDNALESYNFEPYNHVGLGLPIARWIVARHDGALTLAEPAGPGATFRIEIPQAQEDLREGLGR